MGRGNRGLQGSASDVDLHPGGSMPVYMHRKTKTEPLRPVLIIGYNRFLKTKEISNKKYRSQVYAYVPKVKQLFQGPWFCMWNHTLPTPPCWATCLKDEEVSCAHFPHEYRGGRRRLSRRQEGRRVPREDVEEEGDTDPVEDKVGIKFLRTQKV